MRGRLRFLRALISNPLTSHPAIRVSRSRQPPTAFAQPSIAYISDPDILDEVLVDRVGDFSKTIIDQQILKPAFGNSLLVAEGEAWRWKRRLAAPSSHRQPLPSRPPQIVGPFQDVAKDWQSSQGGRDIDVVPAMTAATLDVIDQPLVLRARRDRFQGASRTAIERISWGPSHGASASQASVCRAGCRFLAGGKVTPRQGAHARPHPEL